MSDKYPKWHGSPYDRGSADAWYRRPFDPHKYPMGTYVGDKVVLTDSDEIEAYRAGYRDGMDSGDHKDWGGPPIDAKSWESMLRKEMGT